MWSEGALKIVPYGDDTISGNGATYTPNLTPIYDLNDDDYIVSGPGEDPVNCERKTPADAYNQVQVEYLNRANAYNVEISEAKDQANIEKYGLRPQEPVKMHGICDPDVARRAAQLLLQRALYVRNEYEFQLGWKHCLLEPMDLVTLTDSGLGLAKTPVRITSVEEDEDGLLTILAEDYPFGVASATLYPSQHGAGYAANYNVAPGNVATPVFFEPPIEQATATGLEVWCAVSGQAGSAGSYWGGCSVWASIDGITYKKVGTVRGGARYGALTAPLAPFSTGIAAVSLAGRGGEMLSGTAQDAALLNTLCWVGNASGGEFFAYQTATLINTNGYSLTTLVRGAFTSVVTSRPAGAQFVRVDEAIAKSEPLDFSMIGKTIYFKFTSYNVYQAAEQDLADVQAYPYIVTGSMAELPPPAFDVASIVAQPDGTRQYNFGYSTGAPIDWLGAEIRYISGTLTAPDWDSMTPLQDTATYYTGSPVELNAPLSGAYTFAFRSLDKLGNHSTSVVRQITLPDRRMGNTYDAWDDAAQGWPGTKTGCVILGRILEAVDSTTWDTLPATWDAWTRWNLNPTTPIYYETPLRDLEVVVNGSVNTVVDADGVVLQQLATSADGITWSAWADATNAFSSRYIKLRIRVTATATAPVPVVRAFSYSVNVQLKSEYLNDVVLSALTGSLRIAVGDVRIPIKLAYTYIKRTTVVVQDTRNGTWSYVRLDQALTPGPRWQFRLNGVLTDPQLVDFFVEGF